MSKKSNMKLTEKQVIAEIKKKCLPRFIGVGEYNKYATYIRKWEKGTLKDTGRNKLFAFFGYEPECVFNYDEGNDKSITV